MVYQTELFDCVDQWLDHLDPSPMLNHLDLLPTLFNHCDSLSNVLSFGSLSNDALLCKPWLNITQCNSWSKGPLSSTFVYLIHCGKQHRHLQDCLNCPVNFGSRCSPSMSDCVPSSQVQWDVAVFLWATVMLELFGVDASVEADMSQGQHLSTKSLLLGYPGKG